MVLTERKDWQSDIPDDGMRHLVSCDGTSEERLAIPTERLASGSTFYEEDTDKVFEYSESADDWHEI